MSTSPTAPRTLTSVVVALGLAVAACSTGSASEADTAPRIIQPGAPGEPSRELTPEEAAELAAIPDPTDDDIQFMSAMHPHHAQALEMTALVEGRTASEQIPLFAERMRISQEDELRQIQDWLEHHQVDAVDQLVDDTHLRRHDHAGATSELMPGMLTEDELAELEAAQGTEFDRLFLESMIRHHLGAIQMVEDLLANEDAAADPGLWDFVNHVVSDQRIEIRRMEAMLAAMDPASEQPSPAPGG